MTSSASGPRYPVPMHLRLTTNFANLAKDSQGRSERIASTLASIDRRFHQAMGEPEEAAWYRLALESVTIGIRFEDDAGERFPMIETLRCRFHDSLLDRSLHGPTGCNYSAYVRDHDYSTRTPAGDVLRPDLSNGNHDPPPATYDRVERGTTLGRRRRDGMWQDFSRPLLAGVTLGPPCSEGLSCARSFRGSSRRRPRLLRPAAATSDTSAAHASRRDGMVLSRELFAAP